MAKLPVLVTRAHPGGLETAARLEAIGFEPVLCPALELVARPDVPLDIAGAAGLIFTSANGVRFFTERARTCTLKAWCVGPATLRAALNAGFERAVSADGNAQDLAQLISSEASAADGPLVHVANTAAAGHLAETLQGRGFDIRFAPIYETRDIEDVPTHGAHDYERARKLISGSAPVVILIHSAKGADAFRAFLHDADMKGKYLVAVSKAAAAPLQPFPFEQTAIADRPNEDRLIHTLESLASAL